MTEATLAAVDAAARRPSIAACAAFSLGVGLFAALIAATLRSSLNEALPVTVVVYAAVIGLLRLSKRHTFWQAAISLALVVLVPCFLRLPPSPGAFTVHANLYCQSPLVDPLFASLVLFPVIEADATLLGIVAGFAAAMALRSTPTAPLLAVLRWVAVVAALVIVGATLTMARGRPDAASYLASLPLVATLDLPPAEASSPQVQRPVETMVGPLAITLESDSLQIRAADSPGPSYEGIGCLEAHQRLLLRADPDLGVWLLEIHEAPVPDAGRFDPPPTKRVAYRLDPASKSGVAPADVTTKSVMQRTAPPPGWIEGPLLGVVIALIAAWRRGQAAAALRALVGGVDGVAHDGWIELSGGQPPIRVPANDKDLAGPVVVTGASPSVASSTSTYRVEPAAAAREVQSGTLAELRCAAQRRILAWDLHGLTAVMLSLAAITPWIRELDRMFFG